MIRIRNLGLRLVKNNRADEKGFSLYSSNGPLILRASYWNLWRFQKRDLLGWAVKLNLAGHTAHASWRASGGYDFRQTGHRFWRNGQFPFRLGITHRGNVPYGFRA